MSVQNQIDRLTGAAADIRSAVSAKGVNVPDGTKLDAMSAYIDAIQTGDGIMVDHITVTTPPNKAAYEAGEVFNPDGMAVSAVYTNGATRPIADFTFEPSGPLTVDVTSVTIIAVVDGVLLTATQAISVNSYRVITGDIVSSGKAVVIPYTGTPFYIKIVSKNDPSKWIEYDANIRTDGYKRWDTEIYFSNEGGYVRENECKFWINWPDGEQTYEIRFNG